jgi:hypothetical protein
VAVSVRRKQWKGERDICLLSIVKKCKQYVTRKVEKNKSQKSALIAMMQWADRDSIDPSVECIVICSVTE